MPHGRLSVKVSDGQRGLDEFADHGRSHPTCGALVDRARPWL